MAGWQINERSGMPERIRPELRQAILGTDPGDWRRRKCFLDGDQKFSDLASECLRKSDGVPVLLLWGDSSAASLVPGLMSPRQNFQFAQITASACSPLHGYNDPDLRPFCSSIQNDTWAWIRANPPRIVLLSSAVQTLVDPSTYATKMVEVIEKLKEAGVLNVLVTGIFPVWDAPFPEMYYRRAVRYGETPDTIALRNADLSRNFDTVMRDAVTKAGATFISVLDGLCPADKCRTTVLTPTGKSLIQFDAFHFSSGGASWIADHLILPSLPGRTAKQ